ncbi:hypothetical protein MBAV_003160 [Candidatus Magnetobacterium bavaricum]|uniref:Uncharacterized protein n=1 Tax=Candidatus Magnetobacterium bavaricum TaxID=29290 RepID=A0A0F3GRQ6_9BACT|nr:hypothetical protein MBAV_003160 [Candidatus Magnetobacterium bavaricum]
MADASTGETWPEAASLPQGRIGALRCTRLWHNQDLAEETRLAGILAPLSLASCPTMHAVLSPLSEVVPDFAGGEVVQGRL